MADCCNPSGYRHFFNEREARRNLANYDKRGLDDIAGAMVDYMVSRSVRDISVLEVGGGIGAVQVELLKAGAKRTVNVELSSGYESVAADLLEREGLSGRATRELGDFTALADDLIADDVFLNRVICCYPDMPGLLRAAMSSSRRLVAASFPRDRLGARITIGIGNFYCRIRNVDFRAFVHPVPAIEETVTAQGFRIVFEHQNFIWRGVVLEREGRLTHRLS